MIELPIWLFVVLCVLAAPVALVIVVFGLLAVFVIISMLVVLVIDLFSKDDIYIEEDY